MTHQLTLDIPHAAHLVQLTDLEHFAIVDPDDYALVGDINWTYARHYAVRNRKSEDGTWGTETMHRLLTGWPMVDHINGNGLDNRRTNLRPASHAENSRNRRRPRNNTSGYKGVQFRNDAYRSKPWYAMLQMTSGRKYLGAYATAEEAAIAYDEAALDAFGEFAWLNFPGREGKA